MVLFGLKWKEKAKDWVFGPLSPGNTPDRMPRAPIPADQRYVSVQLKSFRIVDVRRGWSKFYGVVYSRIGVTHLGDAGSAEFNVVTVPAMLKDVDPSGLDRVIQLDLPLAGPIPYRGGPLDLELGLFSIKSKDMAGPFIDLLQDLSQQAGVAYVSKALPFIGPIKKGVEMLTGQGQDALIEVGAERREDPPTTGWYVVIAEDKAKSRYKPSELRVDPNDMRLVDGAGAPVQNVAYFMFAIKASEQRDDWHQVPELRELHGQLNEDLRKNRINDAKESLATLKRYLLTSPDLLPGDANRIYKIAEERAQAVFPHAVGTAARKARGIGELETWPLYAHAR